MILFLLQPYLMPILNKFLSGYKCGVVGVVGLRFISDKRVLK